MMSLALTLILSLSSIIVKDHIAVRVVFVCLPVSVIMTFIRDGRVSRVFLLVAAVVSGINFLLVIVVDEALHGSDTVVTASVLRQSDINPINDRLHGLRRILLSSSRCHRLEILVKIPDLLVSLVLCELFLLLLVHIVVVTHLLKLFLHGWLVLFFELFR